MKTITHSKLLNIVLAVLCLFLLLACIALYYRADHFFDPIAATPIAVTTKNGDGISASLFFTRHHDQEVWTYHLNSDLLAQGGSQLELIMPTGTNPEKTYSIPFEWHKDANEAVIETDQWVLIFRPKFK